MSGDGRGRRLRRLQMSRRGGTRGRGDGGSDRSGQGWRLEAGSTFRSGLAVAGRSTVGGAVGFACAPAIGARVATAGRYEGQWQTVLGAVRRFDDTTMGVMHEFIC